VRPSLRRKRITFPHEKKLKRGGGVKKDISEAVEGKARKCEEWAKGGVSASRRRSLSLEGGLGEDENTSLQLRRQRMKRVCLSMNLNWTGSSAGSLMKWEGSEMHQQAEENARIFEKGRKNQKPPRATAPADAGPGGKRPRPKSVVRIKEA